MARFVMVKARAKDLAIDDHFKLAGYMYRIDEIPRSQYGNPKLHIVAVRVGGDDRYESITLFVHPYTKFKKVKLYNQDKK